MPNLIEVQIDSYNWFLEKGLKEVLHDVSPITDFSGNLLLEFNDYYLEDNPKYSVEECKERDATYSKPLKNEGKTHQQKKRARLKSRKFLWVNFRL
ncbi:MAG: hypothetical protein L6V93_16575 [Clostridiales bacterium]|nr:MAG: hypothetical protein L6V93_16575 [Clostridiales bacterium]